MEIMEVETKINKEMCIIILLNLLREPGVEYHYIGIKKKLYLMIPFSIIYEYKNFMSYIGNMYDEGADCILKDGYIVIDDMLEVCDYVGIEHPEEIFTDYKKEIKNHFAKG